jgi:hypothetical protein
MCGPYVCRVSCELPCLCPACFFGRKTLLCVNPRKTHLKCFIPSPLPKRMLILDG